MAKENKKPEVVTEAFQAFYQKTIQALHNSITDEELTNNREAAQGHYQACLQRACAIAFAWGKDAPEIIADVAALAYHFRSIFEAAITDNTKKE